MGVAINWSIDFGTILMLGVTVLGAFAADMLVKHDVKTLTTQITKFEAAIETLTKAVTELMVQTGRHDERIEALQSHLRSYGTTQGFRQPESR